MPGRLLNFVSRSTPHSSSSSINESVAPSPKKRVHNYRQRFPSPSSHSRASLSPERRSSFTMDHLLNLTKDKDKDKDKDRENRREKLTSLTNHVKRASSGSRDRLRAQSGPRTSSPRLAPVVATAFKMDCVIESPPLVFYGNIANSTGALLSGRLRLMVAEEVTLQNFTMELQAVTTVKKPVEKNCPDCQTQRSVIKSWEFITEPMKLLKGTHQYPFSHLVPGHLPATTHAYLGSIDYHLVARAHSKTHHHDTKDTVFTHPLKIQRSIIPGSDKCSIRIFPPTNLTARVVLPPVIHPIGEFPISMVMSGIVDKGKDTQTRWRLRKVNWRIEEHQKVVSPACTKHSAKLGGEGKGMQHTNVRTIGQDEIKSGWKTDWDTVGGEINMEFQASINPAGLPTCDVEAPTGLEVTHNFVVELIVAEEYCPNKNTRLITPTGAARVLRMQFKAFVTERPGLGISWDEEMPPVYSEVPASPPNYRSTTVLDYGGPPLEYEELDRMDRSSPLRDRSGSSHSGGRLSSPLQRPVRPAYNVDDLEHAPIIPERRPDDVPLDPEDMRL